MMHFDVESAVNGQIVITDKTRSVSDAEASTQQLPFDNQTLFLSINGTIGNIALYNGEKIMLGKSAAYICCLSSLYRNYLSYFLSSTQCEMYFTLSMSGTTISNLSLESIRFTKVAHPSIEEQIEIVTYLDKKTTELDTLKAEAQRGIDLLKERRSALISAAVTGKIDVRGLVNTEAA